jgi:anti-sigma factor RsiW
MSCANTTEWVSERLKGLLSADDERRLEAHLSGCPACRAEADALSALWTDMRDVDVDVPHERMRARFHAALAAYDARVRSSILEQLIESFWPQRPIVQMALAAALAVAGVLIGQRLPSTTETELAELRADVRTVGLALLDHQSASERLLGIAWSRRIDSAQAVDALLERVQYDENLNVRLAAVEALRARLDVPEVGAGLAAALERQDAPLLQVTMADALLETGGSDAIEAVRRMLGRQELDPAVREYLRMALADAQTAAPDV